MESLLLWFFYIFSFYAFLPGVVSRLFGFRVIKRGISDTDISLTFDDGPDPVYTPQLLDLLQKHQVRATFFIVGKHAELYPEIVRRIHEEGHSIGIHNYVHRSNWLMRPKTVARHVKMTADIIENITGEKPQYYRPPWGILNLFDYSSKGQLQIVLWSMMAGDWRKSTGAATIYRRMIRKLRGGEIYLLHDSGKTFGADEDAPQNMIEALESFIPVAIKRGYIFVRVDELVQVTGRMSKKRVGLGKKIVVSCWLLWERCFHVLFRLQSATADDARSFLHYRVMDYQGETIPLSEGDVLQRGDRVVELHMNNALLYEFGQRARSPVQLAIQLIRAMERTMPQLAERLLSEPDAPKIKAVLGTTMVHRGVEQFGFSVADMPKGWFSFASRYYLRFLLSVIHPQGKVRLDERSEMLVPKRIAISMKQLECRYGTSGSSIEKLADGESTNSQLA